MIPYFQFLTIPIGPLRIQVWGLFVALGIIAALMIGRREARKRGIDAAEFTDMAAWIIVLALIGARLFHAFVYDPAPFIADPWKLVRVWEGGMSSYGGFIGAAIAAAIFVRRRRIPFLPYADVAAYALPCGYGIGRIGCFLIHDHPGTLSDSALAVRYPDGARLDHGLLLSLLGLAMFALFFSLNRRTGGFPKIFLPLFMVLYGAARFILDFFRASDLPGADVRYWSLTPAQYGSALAFIAGAVWIARVMRPRSKAGAADA